MYEYKAKLVRVIDGDTIDCMIDLGFDIWFKARVRMYGINTPESRTRDKEEKKRGLLAKARLKELLIKDNRGDYFIINTLIDKKNKKEKGKFGRVLGTIIVNDININKQLIDEGHAVAYFGGKR